MPNTLPIFFIVLAGLALVSTLLWLWQSLRLAFIHTLAAPAASGVISPERAALLAEKQSLLMALKDLEAERDSGKLSGSDYRDLNEQYRQRAREVLRQLDAMLAPHREGAKAILAAVGTTSSSGNLAAVSIGTSSSSGSILAASSVSASGVSASTAESPAAVSCKSCGASNDGDAVFCKRCGTRVQAGVNG
ncbi:MAG: hypothetical protein RL701_4810 [Pseudomonadota bacterium]|jgi:hypothetical protein